MLLLIGIIVGLILGLTGAGGSVFAVPLLMLFAGQSMSEAIGISLGAVASSTLYASLRNLRNNTLLWAPIIILAIAGMITASIGKWLSTQLPQLGILLAFNALALVIAARMWLSAKRDPVSATVVRASSLSVAAESGLLCRFNANGKFELRPRCMFGLIFGGLVTGLLSGLFGVGGGFLIVPLLLFLTHVSMAQAISSSLVIITFISGSGFVSHLLLGSNTQQTMNWAAFFWVAGGGVIGMFAGQRLSRFIAGAKLQQGFALCLVLISVLTLLFR
jgi:uncharacterized protein